MALNCFTAPAGMEELFGAIWRETRVALVTVTEAVAAMLPEVAVTVEVPGATPRLRPLASTVSTLVTLEDHCKEVRTWVLPSSKLPVAVNCCGVPAAMDTAAGEMVMEVSCAETTVIVVESVKEPTVAVMLVVPAARIRARPLLSMVTTEVVEEVQVTPLTRSWTEPSL